MSGCGLVANVLNNRFPNCGILYGTVVCPPLPHARQRGWQRNRHHVDEILRRGTHLSRIISFGTILEEPTWEPAVHRWRFCQLLSCHILTSQYMKSALARLGEVGVPGDGCGIRPFFLPGYLIAFWVRSPPDVDLPQN